MGQEAATYINDLVITNPVDATDIVRYGAYHLRTIKTAVKYSFPGFAGAVICTGTDAGAADAYAINPATPLSGYVSNMLVLLIPANTNATTTPTLNVSGLGTRTIVSVTGGAMQALDLVAGHPYLLRYDTTTSSFWMVSVTKNYIDQLAFSAALPAQPGGLAPYSLKSINSVAAWEIKGAIDRRAITSADTVGVADIGGIVDCTSGSFTLAFASTATLGDQASGWIMNSGTGDITVDPSGAETIDGVASFVMYTNEVRRWYVEGSVLRTMVIRPFYRKAVSSFTFTMPPGYAYLDLDIIGGGGGGGSGRKGAAGSKRNGGSPGGAPGRVRRRVRGLTPASTVSVTVGAGGTGGATQSTNSTNGNNGTAGGDTSFGAYATVKGGAAGLGGTNNANGQATSGSGVLSAGTSATSSSDGGGPIATNYGNGSTNNTFNLSEGGSGTVVSAGAFQGSCSEWGGAGSGSAIDATTASTSGSSLRGVSAAGIGGWITTTNTMPTIAGTAGLNGTYTVGGGAAGGTCGGSPTVGANGATTTTDEDPGQPGGGGGSSHTATAMAGGNGSAPGGPGGGGGASTDSVGNSGPGGNGADGRILIAGVL